MIRQAAWRLVASLGLFAVAVGISTAFLYGSALDKARIERLRDLEDFYRARLTQIDRQWELQSADFRVRIEFARILEDRRSAAQRIQAFMTVQGGGRQFSYMLVEDKSGRPLLTFGKGLSLRSSPLPSGVDSGWYLGPANRLYRVFSERIWLGDGNGRFSLFFPVDNALLYQMTTPGTTLTVTYRDLTVASSAGSVGVVGGAHGVGNERRVDLDWVEGADFPVRLSVQAPVKGLFSSLEIVLGASVIPLIDVLILWLALGIWMMANARRIAELGAAVREFGSTHALSASLHDKLDRACANRADEIHEVAEAFKDMTEVLVRRQRMRESEEAERRLWAMVFASSGEGIVITDAENRIVAVNDAFTRLTGYTEAEVLGMNPSILSAHMEEPAFYRDMWQELVARNTWQGEVYDRRKDGSVYPKWLTISVIRNREGGAVNYIGMFSDITDRKQAEERILHLATHDTLTGLPNRQLLQDRLETGLALAQRQSTLLAVLFIDLDRFKWINDSLGHEYGDGLLVEIAARFGASVRGSDTVARLGGDEFVILLQNPFSVADVDHVARKVIAAAGQPIEFRGHVLQVTASVGVSLFPGDATDVTTLLKHADTAMYVAKSSGRNQVCFFDESMNQDAVERHRLELGLRQALKNRELELFYQPKICLSVGVACGVEALLRWRHPQDGLVAPDKFIPVAEETGLIVEIGAWVIRVACEQVMRWRERGILMSVAVNLSAAQLESDALVPMIVATMEETGVPPGLLEFELTESTVLRNPDRSIQTLHRLRELGIGLSLDDFGTGYSSLSYLKRLPFSVVKIDRSFIAGLPDDNDDASIVRMIVALAKSSGLEVVAEGIETEAQRDFLVAIGCDMLQGYLYARPMPVGDLEVWMAAHQCIGCNRERGVAQVTFKCR